MHKRGLGKSIFLPWGQVMPEWQALTWGQYPPEFSGEIQNAVGKDRARPVFEIETGHALSLKIETGHALSLRLQITGKIRLV